MATIRDILIHNKVYSMDLELALLRHFDELRQNIIKQTKTKHYICPTCNRYIDEGLTDTPLGGSATVRGEGGDPYP